MQWYVKSHVPEAAKVVTILVKVSAAILVENARSRYRMSCCLAVTLHGVYPVTWRKIRPRRSVLFRWKLSSLAASIVSTCLVSYYPSGLTSPARPSVATYFSAGTSAKGDAVTVMKKKMVRL